MNKTFFFIRFAAILLIACLFNTCKDPMEKPMLISVSLHQNWEFREAGKGDWLKATVPGTIHHDLLAAGLIPDPFNGTNEKEVQWVENRDWEYRVLFDADDRLLRKDAIVLRFEGIDTYAGVFLNDSLLISADNMFISWEAECKKLLKEGQNELRVVFYSAVRKGMEKLRQLDYILPATNEQAPVDRRTNVFTRKAPFHYGWDWGPRLVTCGIWRPVHLLSWNTARISEIFIKPVDVRTEKASYKAIIEIESLIDTSAEIQVQVSGVSRTFRKNVGLEKGMNKFDIPFEIEYPRLWWSHGLGEPYLYDIGIILATGNDLLDRCNVKTGVRTLELVQEPDSTGRSFYFKINGIPVFAKGANYIPSDILIPRVDKKVYERLIRDALDANMNMLRVWGGAIYENDIFYDLCDENGILVWQDFMFACNMNPGDSAHLENIRKEAEYNVKRLRNRPSTALWCGNNENLVAWHNWGWKESYPPDISAKVWRDYEKIFYEILPEAVTKFHPGVAYWPSSPQSWGDLLPDRRSGDEHDWTVWFGQAPFSNYENNLPRFVSEYGMQSLPVKATIDSFAPENEQDMDSELMRHRQRSKMAWIAEGFDGNDMIRKYVRDYFGEWNSFDELIRFSQLSQALGMKTAIEAHRRNMPWTMGSLYWQINDCWPTVSWASVDYYGRWKASHYWIRKAFSPVLPVASEKEGVFVVHGINDLTTPFMANLNVRLLNTAGQEIKNLNERVVLAANTSTLLFESPPEDFFGKLPVEETLVYVELSDTNGEPISKNLFYRPLPKKLILRPANIETKTKYRDGYYEISLNSDLPALFTFIEVRNMQGHLSDNYVNILPGETLVLQFFPGDDHVRQLPDIVAISYSTVKD